MSQPRAKFLYKYEEEPFSVRRKEFWPLAESGKVLDSLIPKLCHEADGLILQVCVVLCHCCCCCCCCCCSAIKSEHSGRSDGIIPAAAPHAPERRSDMLKLKCSSCVQGYDDEYVNGTCHELLKWKFAHMNSVDFLLLFEEGTAHAACHHR